ncbi:MAG: TetR/AcrR family transcriptional regulator [Candidatus Acidiferrales bacterium]
MFNSAPPTDKGEQTRSTIFEAALQSFREKGFEATTMRDIASAANVALGSAYYYFPSKEALIQAYYDSVQQEHARRVAGALATGSPDLLERLKFAFQSKLDILRNDRKLLGVVFRYSGEPQHSLSCLGPATQSTRRASIELMSNAIGDERMPRDLRQLLPIALWALQMGVLILFIYDESPNQQRTRKLVDGALELTVRLLFLARNPLLKPVRSKVLELLSAADLLPEFGAFESQPEKE